MALLVASRVGECGFSTTFLNAIERLRILSQKRCRATTENARFAHERAQMVYIGQVSTSLPLDKTTSNVFATAWLVGGVVSN